MSQVSRYKLDNRVYQKIFALFPQFLYRMTRSGQQNELVEAFLTRTEKIVIAKRIAIAFMLVKDYKYDEIVHKIKVSHGTVAKIADSLKLHENIIVKELQNISREDSFIQFLNSIGYQASRILPPKGRSWSRWRGQLEKEKQSSKSPF